MDKLSRIRHYLMDNIKRLILSALSGDVKHLRLVTTEAATCKKDLNRIELAARIAPEETIEKIIPQTSDHCFRRTHGVPVPGTNRGRNFPQR